MVERLCGGGDGVERGGLAVGGASLNLGASSSTLVAGRPGVGQGVVDPVVVRLVGVQQEVGEVVIDVCLLLLFLVHLLPTPV